MKVLHLIDSPNRGGAETLVLDLCRNAKQNGLDITIVGTRVGALNEDFRFSGADYYYLPRRHTIDILLISKLSMLVKKKNIQIIHVHQAVDGIHAFLVRLITGVKIVMTFHGHVPNKKDDKVLNFLIPRMNANIAVSNTFLERLKQEFNIIKKKNFVVIYNGIDTKKFYKINSELRKELKIGDSDILMGMIGNFNDNIRDQLTICKVLPTLLSENKNFHFIFVGRRAIENPEYYNDCFELCKKSQLLDKVHFMGPRSDINNILNSLDAFVYASKYDTFGIAVVEAMMAGVPVIMNDLPPLLEISNNGEFAEIYRSRDFENLNDKIKKLIKDKRYKEYLGLKGKEWALQKFSIENHISNLKKLYSTIITK
jgi:glycosyltransferase involved in cell wall biosynthesis